MKVENKITLKVELDDKQIPEKIKWNSTNEGKSSPETECKAFLLSIFDKNTLDTLKIDLWTKEMQVGEMDIFFFQTMRALADTYQRATKNNKLASEMQHFVHYFGEQIKVIKTEES